MSHFNRNTANAGRAKERKTVKLYMSGKHDANNLVAAEIILGDIDKYGGEGSGLVLWCDVFLKRYNQQHEDNRLRDSRAPGKQKVLGV